jgi:putative addiction module CopG family antidote
MPARNVNLTDHLAEFIDASVDSGRFQNASEVVREALRLLEERQGEDELKLEHYDWLTAAVKRTHDTKNAVDVVTAAIARAEMGQELETPGL